MKQLELQRLKAPEAKIPPKIRVYSFVMLVCFMLIYIAVSYTHLDVYKRQLWYARSGFGCEPHSRGRAVFATCLSDGETARWNREDFIGVLNEKYLPDWAREKLMELTAPRQEEPAAGEMKLE